MSIDKLKKRLKMPANTFYSPCGPIRCWRQRFLKPTQSGCPTQKSKWTDSRTKWPPWFNPAAYG